MAILQMPGTGFAADMGMGNTTSPLVVLFERDDTIAVPLLSQLRVTGYDVRAARTPVELFGMLGKQLVALVLVDLGNATAGRREFWVALDAQRRGRSLQVMTFRFITPANALDPDFDPAARALADVEVRGVQEFQKVLDGVRQRIPLNGALPALAAPRAAYGMPSPFSQPSYSPFSQPSPLPSSQPSVPPYASNPQASPFAQPLSASPFAQPAPSNPFSGGQPENNSPFAQPYNVNPFAAGSATPQPGGGSAWGQPPASNPFSQPSQPDPMRFGGQQMPQQQPAHPMNQMNQMGRDEQQIVDVWIPPEEDDQVTSVVPEATFEQIERYGRMEHQSQQSPRGQMGSMGMSQMGAALQESTQRIAAMPTAGAGYTGTPTERALSTVLVEGAMLTDQKLEALRGIQQMLTGVGMQ